MNKISIKKIKKVVIFGGGSLIPELCDYLLSCGIQVSIFAVSRHISEVVDKKGHTLEESLKERQIPCFCENDINQSQQLRAEIIPGTIGIGIGENYVFSTETLGLFERNVFDLMMIRLPRYRGGAHSSWQILQGNRIGAWNIQLVNEEMIPAKFDSGEILFTHEFIIPATARRPIDFMEVYDKEALTAFGKFLKLVDEGTQFRLSALQESFSMYFPRLYTPVNGLINWSWSTDQIEKFICAFDKPFDGAQTFIGKRKLFLRNVVTDFGEASFHPFMNGLIYRIRDEKIYVASNPGTIIISEVRDESKRIVNSELELGMRFFTPYSEIEKAMMSQVEFAPQGPVGVN